MSRHELALIALSALAAYVLCRGQGRGPRRIPADIIALDEPALFQWAARGL